MPRGFNNESRARSREYSGGGNVWRLVLWLIDLECRRESEIVLYLDWLARTGEREREGVNIYGMSASAVATGGD